MATSPRGTPENGWILAAWAQGALVSARAEVRKLRRQPGDRVALNELALALNGARRYASMAGHAAVEAFANEAEDAVFSLRASDGDPTVGWMDDIERRIEAAETALLETAMPAPRELPDGFPRLLRRFRNGHADISDWESLV